MNRRVLMKELTLDEGCVYEIYNDHLGYATFGIGHLITERDPEHGEAVGTPVSEARVQECFNQDIDIVTDELDNKMHWWRGLDDVRKRVLANMCFNLGYPRFSGFKRFLAAMGTSQWETAAVEMMDSKWATQVGDRAERLKQMVLTGEAAHV
jgi:lysozyme